MGIENLKPWPKGKSGNPSGRPKRLLPRVDEVLKAKGLEPIEELLKLLPDLDAKDQAKLWLELMSFVHAKPRGSELDGGEDSPDSPRRVWGQEDALKLIEALPKP